MRPLFLAMLAIGCPAPAGLFAQTALLTADSSVRSAQHLPGPADSPALPPPAIALDQLGFYPRAPKIAIITSLPATAAASAPATATSTTIPSSPGSAPAAAFPAASLFYIVSATNGDTVFSGRLCRLTPSANSPLLTRMADFSNLQKEGIYTVVVPGRQHSYPFRIGRHVLALAAVAALKGYYYQRSAMALEPRYAGQWSRAAGHPDTQVLIHPSAASADRPAGTTISTTGGWYDAGDYNKYIVNSGITMGTLLDAYEDFPSYFDTLRTNIPSLNEAAHGIASHPSATSSASSHSASGNTRVVPDILNEVVYNLRWMLSMQDPGDGGVYNKCTNAVFDGMVMPGVTKTPRYVVQKGTAATLDFAAVMAQAARILRKFNPQLPGLSDTCLQAATRAWQWAVQHPSEVYDQNAMNKLYQPKITTGGYGDRNFNDEWFWAAVELMISTTGNKTYDEVIKTHIDDPMLLPSWANVHMMGDYTLLHHRKELAAPWQPALRSIQERLLARADHYLDKIRSNAFHTVMGGASRDFVWGSNSVAANQGMLLVNAWLLKKDKKYMEAALGNLDYLLGRNATGYCFVTGLGSHSPLHPHHRPSVADGIGPPVPGLLAGGPNPGRQDHQRYPFAAPEIAYTDQDGAYASNEIAINWNAPLVYLAGAIEATQPK